MNVLIVEDDTVLLNAVSDYISHLGHKIIRASTLHEAQESLEKHIIHMLVLDLGLPDGSGLNLIKKIRNKDQQLPVLILSARTALNERVAGLNAGADDYLGKPFEKEELEARVTALLRRVYGLEAKINFGNFKYDAQLKQAYINNKLVELTAREIDLLELLITHRNKILPKQTLLTRLYVHSPDINENALDVCMHRLRKKIETQESQIEIKTIRGMGYLFKTGEMINH